MIKLFVVAVTLVLSTQAFGQFTGESSTEATSVYDHISKQLIGGIKSYNDTTQVYKMDDPKKQKFQGQQEFYLGAKINEDWAVFAQAVQYVNAYNSQSTKPDGVETGDPSLTLVHPFIYNDGNFKINGQIREYFPMSDYFQKRGINEFAYYSFLMGTVGKNKDLFNVVIPRYFAQTHYAAGETKFVLEDRTTVAQKIAKYFKVGVGQWTQMEFHSNTDNGYCTEIYPYVDYLINKNMFLSPRLSFPVLAHGSVYQGPRSVAWDNMRGELYFQASL